MRQGWYRVLQLVVVVWLARASEALAQVTAAPVKEVTSAAAPSIAWAHVSYISGGTVYLDAGSKQGLATGSRLEVVRGTQSVGELTVAYISSTRAACTITRNSVELVVGDSARFTPVAAPEPAPVAATSSTAGTTPTAARRSSRNNALRGRLGVRYLSVDPGGGGAKWTQPAFDLRLDGHSIGGTPLGVVVDVRAYRQRSGATGRNASASTRVYQGSIELASPGAPVRVAMGRQITGALSTIGIFDGITIEANGSHFSGGAVAGSQPDAQTFGLSGEIREYGAYLQAHNKADGSGVWSMTLGAIGSYDKGQIDREFAYLQGMIVSRNFSLYATQEVDVNRGWKADIEGRSTVPTATFATARWSLSDAFSINAGYDNRRSVRLYRDFVDPELEFDDAFRQGGWAGFSINAGRHFRMYTDARQSSGGSSGDAQSYTGSLGLYRMSVLGLGFQLRATQYSGSVAQGQLMSGSLELNPWNKFRLEASSGTRIDTRDPTPTGLPRSRLDWQGLDVDFGIGRSFYVILSGYSEKGDAGRSLQSYAGLSWRF